MQKLTCTQCGNEFERTGKRGRPRSECYTCTPAGVYPSKNRKKAAGAGAIRANTSGWKLTAAAATWEEGSNVDAGR